MKQWKQLNEKLIENIQKLSDTASDYEITVYGPTTRGTITISDGRIVAAETAKSTDEEALKHLLDNASTKFAVRKIESHTKPRNAMNLRPAEAVISLLMDESTGGDPELEETQLIDFSEIGRLGSADLHLYEIVLVEGRKLDNKKEHPLLPGRNKIGRMEECHVTVDSKLASRNHAVIIVRNGGAFLKDEQSLNGTKVNGKYVCEQPLHDGDVIEIGGVLYEVQYRLKIRNHLSHASGGRSDGLPEKLTRVTRRVSLSDANASKENSVKLTKVLSDLFTTSKKEEVHLGVVKAP